MEKVNLLEINSRPVWTESTESGRPFSNGNLGYPKRSFESSGVSTPAVNIIETREDLRLEMVAPGMRKEAFNVTLQEDVLTISYDHHDNSRGGGEDWKYRLREYNYHSFMRSFQLPDTIDSGRIDATYVDGILTLRIPKKKEAIARMIAVE